MDSRDDSSTEQTGCSLYFTITEGGGDLKKLAAYVGSERASEAVAAFLFLLIHGREYDNIPHKMLDYIRDTTNGQHHISQQPIDFPFLAEYEVNEWVEGLTTEVKPIIDATKKAGSISSRQDAFAANDRHIIFLRFNISKDELAKAIEDKNLAGLLDEHLIEAVDYINASARFIPHEDINTHLKQIEKTVTQDQDNDIIIRKKQNALNQLNNLIDKLDKDVQKIRGKFFSNLFQKYEKGTKNKKKSALESLRAAITKNPPKSWHDIQALALRLKQDKRVVRSKGKGKSHTEIFLDKIINNDPSLLEEVAEIDMRLRIKIK